jgi:hypothetical protein
MSQSVVAQAASLRFSAKKRGSQANSLRYLTGCQPAVLDNSFA